MKSLFLALGLMLAIGALSPVAAQCSCTGSGCDCRCTKGPCCVCACDGGLCICKCVQASPASVSITPGTTVNSAVERVSTAVGEHVVILAGGDQPVPSQITSAPWQALARLNLLPGVKLGVVTSVEERGVVASAEEEVKRTLPGAAQGGPEKSRVHELRRVPMNDVISLCVSEAVGLENALESLSVVSGYAFDVSGSPARSFTLTAKGTVEEIVEQLSTSAHVRISIVH